MPAKLLIITLFSLAISVLAEDRKIAVLNLGGKISEQTCELLLVSLSENGFSIVERDKMKQFSNEILIAFSSSSPARETVKIGNIVGADILLLLSDSKTGSASMAICDCSTGARLGNVEDISPTDIFSAVKQIKYILNRFPDGVKNIVVVSDFLNSNLELKNDHLKGDLPSLLKHLLLEQAGVAVMETNEPVSIAMEKEISNNDTQGRISIFVEGEFNTIINNGEALIAISMSAKNSRDQKRFSSGNIPIEKAGIFISQKVFDEIRKLLDAGNPATTSNIDQSKSMIDTADMFSSYGEHILATNIRESALLLDPDNLEQRKKIVRGYMESKKENTYLFLHFKYEKEEIRTSLIDGAQKNWKRAISHFEYLIRNKMIYADEALDMMRDGIFYPPERYADGKDSEYFPDDSMPVLWQEIKEIAPLLFNLEKNPKKKKYANIQDDGDFGVEILQTICRYPTKNDAKMAEIFLDVFADLLTDILPNDSWSPEILCKDFDPILKKVYQSSTANSDCTPFKKFISRLANSNRTNAKAYAIYAEIFQSPEQYRNNLQKEECQSKIDELSKIVASNTQKYKELRHCIALNLGYKRISDNIVIPNIFKEK